MAMSDKLKKMAYEYVIHGKNKVEAYKAAYEIPSGLTARQICNRADKAFSGKAIQAEIERLREECRNTEIVTRDELLLGLKELIDDTKSCMSRVIHDEDGNEEHIIIPKYAEIYIKAVDRVAKLIGADAPEKVENDINVHIGKELAKYGN